MSEAELIRGDRDEALDGLRAIAALLVVFYHCSVNFWLRPFFIPGYVGVHLFFVLSGYLIARPFLARMISGQPLPSWRKYAVRRFVRIYPTYFVALVFFVVMRFVGHLHRPTNGDIFRHALLIFNWGKPAEFISINIVFWTLAIEAQFYVVLPLAAALTKRLCPGRGRQGALLLVIAFVVIGLVSRGLEYSATASGSVRFRLPFSFLDLFAMGICAAYFELTQSAFFRPRLALRAALLLCAAALLLGSNVWLGAGDGVDWLTPPTLALVCLYPIGICTAFGLIVLALRTRTNYRIALLTSPPLTFIGRISYSMYLYHVGVGYLLLTRVPDGLRVWLGTHLKIYAFAQLGPVVALSYLAYRAVELPSLRWLDRFAVRARAAGSGVVVTKTN